MKNFSDFKTYALSFSPPYTHTHTQTNTQNTHKTGEEITISYIDEHLGLRDRRDLLSYPYLFVCCCPKCVEEEEEGEEEEGEYEEEEEEEEEEGEE